MPRIARAKGVDTTYHIIIRGNEKRKIFLSDNDRNRFLDTLYKAKSKYNFEVEAYCLLDNHVHLIIDDNGNDISQIMKSINTSYAAYFNKVYNRVGHLFQDRFRSEIVNDDKYLMCLSAYIHNNPVRAGIVKLPEEYNWSSMREYLGKESKLLTRTERVLNFFSSNIQKAVNGYYEFTVKFKHQDVMIMDIEEDIIMEKRRDTNFIETFDDAKARLNKELEARKFEMSALKSDKKLRKEMMEMLRKNSSLTLAQIGELCGGFAESTVCLILKGRNAK